MQVFRWRELPSSVRLVAVGRSGQPRNGIYLLGTLNSSLPAPFGASRHPLSNEERTNLWKRRDRGAPGMRTAIDGGEFGGRRVSTNRVSITLAAISGVRVVHPRKTWRGSLTSDAVFSQNAKGEQFCPEGVFATGRAGHQYHRTPLLHPPKKFRINLKFFFPASFATFSSLTTALRRFIYGLDSAPDCGGPRARCTGSCPVRSVDDFTLALTSRLPSF